MRKLGLSAGELVDFVDEDLLGANVVGMIERFANSAASTKETRAVLESQQETLSDSKFMSYLSPSKNADSAATSPAKGGDHVQHELLRREVQNHVVKQFNRHSRSVMEGSQKHIVELV